jgi:hypothetical protein
MTTEAPATNPHQPATQDTRIACAAPDCGYAMHRHPNPDGSSMDAFLLDLFHRNHSRQYDPGRAPDIAVDWEISACCSVCPDGIGDVRMEDSESVRCKECGTTWDIRGTSGERAEAEA